MGESGGPVYALEMVVEPIHHGGLHDIRKPVRDTWVLDDAQPFRTIAIGFSQGGAEPFRTVRRHLPIILAILEGYGWTMGVPVQV